MIREFISWVQRVALYIYSCILHRRTSQVKMNELVTGEDSDGYESSEEDSGFADDESLPMLHSGGDFDKQDVDSLQDENESVLDADVKRQQRITLMSLLYSRMLEKKINEMKRMKASYQLTNEDHYRSKKWRPGKT